MIPKKQKFNFASDEQKMIYLKEIISFFKKERDEEIGLVAAETVLDFFTQTMGDEIYKKAINDCKKLLNERFDDLDIELDILSPRK